MALRTGVAYNEDGRAQAGMGVDLADVSPPEHSVRGERLRKILARTDVPFPIREDRQQAYEAELRNARDELELRVEERTVELEKASKQAKEARTQLLTRFEQHYLKALLHRNRGNITRSAHEAGLTRYHLRELLKRHELQAGACTGRGLLTPFND